MLRAWLLNCVIASWCAAEVLHVPEDFVTIQSALDALNDGDTVLVGLGVYEEALQAPSMAFALLGDVEVDTGDYARPIVDPTSLPNPNTLSCLILPGGSTPTVEDMTFRNGAAMHPNRPGWSTGGVRNHSTDAVFRRCIFDSTFVGLRTSLGRVHLTDCEFRQNSPFCTLAQQVSCQFSAEGCFFSGSGGPLVLLGDSTVLESCWFKESINGGIWLLINGAGVKIKHCQFGPSDNWCHLPLEANPVRGCHVEGNIFTELTLGRAAALIECSAGTDTTYVTGNVFWHNRVVEEYGGGGLEVFAAGSPRPTVIISENVFDSCRGNVLYRDLFLNDSVQVYRNRFNGPPQTNIPAVQGNSPHPPVLRENIFTNTGLAARSFTGDSLDARWNWWGDSTGPYHSALNPAGQGDMVGNGVLFTPWHPDTSFLNLRGIRTPLPEQFELSAYPNPFNSSVTLTLVPSQVAIVRVELFDILGRRVQEIWSGPLAYEKRFVFDGSRLASGIYFVRVWQVIGNRPLALKKVVLMR